VKVEEIALNVAPSPESRKTRRTQRERSALAQSKLLSAAIELIVERGFINATMGDVATRAGMTRGAIQHHFSSRDELVLAILHELERQIVEAFERITLKPGRDATERVSRLIDALGTLAQSDAYLAVVDIWMSTRSEVELREGVRASMARSFQAYRALWQRSLDGLVPAALISDCRRIVVTTMRGVVVSRIFIADKTSVKASITNCKKVVMGYLRAEIAAARVSPETACATDHARE
jgi:AcrR family transcriptional regulator